MQIFGIKDKIAYIHVFTHAKIHHVDSSRYYAPVNVNPHPRKMWGFGVI